MNKFNEIAEGILVEAGRKNVIRFFYNSGKAPTWSKLSSWAELRKVKAENLGLGGIYSEIRTIYVGGKLSKGFMIGVPMDAKGEEQIRFVIESIQQRFGQAQLITFSGN
jgi:hypothetical protein